jgi:hypothetical protein
MLFVRTACCQATSQRESAFQQDVTDVTSTVIRRSRAILLLAIVA